MIKSSKHNKLLFIKVAASLVALGFVFTTNVLAMQTNEDSSEDIVKGSTLSIEKLKQKAKEGDVQAQNTLGWMCESGKGVEQDDHEAVKWYRLAADEGLAKAQHNLALMYESGKGVDQDDQEAVKWYRLAADQGLAKAQNNLGLMLENGKGIDKDKKEAVRWYKKAADQGLPEAQNNLAVCYLKGIGTKKDGKQAEELFQLAAERGYDRAQWNLAILYKHGVVIGSLCTSYEIRPNKGEASKWLQKAANQGNIEGVARARLPSMPTSEP